jgi:hypothetical protein
MDSRWIRTYSGSTFDFCDVQNSLMHIEDIAHALANTCRYTGHPNRFYSVAEHSIYVAMSVKPEYQLVGLLHDAAEAYVGDVSSPLKALLPDYRRIEEKVWKRVVETFKLLDYLPHSVYAVDKNLQQVEMDQLFDPPPRRHGWRIIAGGDPHIPGGKIRCLPPEAAKAEFLRMFHQLTHARRDA